MVDVLVWDENVIPIV